MYSIYKSCCNNNYYNYTVYNGQKHLISPFLSSLCILDKYPVEYAWKKRNTRVHFRSYRFQAIWCCHADTIWVVQALYPSFLRKLTCIYHLITPKYIYNLNDSTRGWTLSNLWKGQIKNIKYHLTGNCNGELSLQ